MGALLPQAWERHRSPVFSVGALVHGSTSDVINSLYEHASLTHSFFSCFNFVFFFVSSFSMISFFLNHRIILTPWEFKICLQCSLIKFAPPTLADPLLSILSQFHDLFQFWFVLFLITCWRRLDHAYSHGHSAIHRSMVNLPEDTLFLLKHQKCCLHYLFSQHDGCSSLCCHIMINTQSILSSSHTKLLIATGGPCFALVL